MFIGDTYSCCLVTENYVGAETIQNGAILKTELLYG